MVLIPPDGAAEYARSTLYGTPVAGLGVLLKYVHLLHCICEKDILALWATTEAATDDQRTTRL